MDSDYKKTNLNPETSEPVVNSPKKELPTLEGVYDPTDKELPELPDEFLTPEQLARKQELAKRASEAKLEAQNYQIQSSQKQTDMPNRDKQEAQLDEIEGVVEEDDEQQDRPHKKLSKKKRRDGVFTVFKRLLSCRCLGCGSLLLIFFVIFGFLFVVISRPPQIWEPFKVWLNADLRANSHDGTTLASAKTELEFQIKEFNIGENELIITESQLKPLINQRLDNVKAGEIHSDIQSGGLKLYWNITTAEQNPLWVIIYLTTDSSGQIQVEWIGTERIPLPRFLNSMFTDITLTAMNLSGSNSATELMGILLPLPDNVQVQKVEFEEDQMVITLDVQTGLDSILDF